jgi:hypothetical protein
MTLRQVAALLIRLISIYYFIAAVVVLTEIPVVLSEALHSTVDYIASDHWFAALMLIVRLFIYAGVGICFLIFARPLAGLFTKDLQSINDDDAA